MKPFIPLPKKLYDNPIVNDDPNSFLLDNDNNIFVNLSAYFDRNSSIHEKMRGRTCIKIPPPKKVKRAVIIHVRFDIALVVYTLLDDKMICKVLFTEKRMNGRKVRINGVNMKITNDGEETVSSIVKGVTPYNGAIFGLTERGDLIGWFMQEEGRIPNEGKILSLPLLQKEKVADLACGAHHALILTTCGRVISTGYNGKGQLGVGDLSTWGEMRAIDKLEGKRVCAIACGYDHSMAIDTQHHVYQWGGVITERTGDKSHPHKEPDTEGKNGEKAFVEYLDYRIEKNYSAFRREPTVIEKLTKFKAKKLSCGFDSSLVVTVDGRVFLWGIDAYQPGLIYYNLKGDKVGRSHVVSEISEVRNFTSGIKDAFVTSIYHTRLVAFLTMNGRFFFAGYNSKFLTKDCEGNLSPLAGILSRGPDSKLRWSLSAVRFTWSPIDQWMLESRRSFCIFTTFIYEPLRRRLLTKQTYYRMYLENFEEHYGGFNRSEKALLNIPKEIWGPIFEYICPIIDWNEIIREYMKKKGPFFALMNIFE